MAEWHSAGGVEDRGGKRCGWESDVPWEEAKDRMSLMATWTTSTGSWTEFIRYEFCLRSYENEVRSQSVEELQTVLRQHRLALCFACSLSSAFRIIDQRNEFTKKNQTMRVNVWLHAARVDHVRSSEYESRLACA